VRPRLDPDPSADRARKRGFTRFLFTRKRPTRPPARSRFGFDSEARGASPDLLTARLGDLSRHGAFVVLGDLSSDPPAIRVGRRSRWNSRTTRPEKERPIVACNVRWLGFLSGQEGLRPASSSIQTRGFKAEVKPVLLQVGRRSASRALNEGP